MPSNFEKLLKHVWRHKEIVLIMILATWLRVWQLDTHLILFGDAAFDIQNAITAVQTRTVPLLGIASSVPRFKQGPLTVWLEMIIYLAAGRNLFAFGLVFAALGIAAVMGTYELFASEGRERLGLLSSFFLAVAPLAIAHSRMPYHVVPIPFCLVIYFWSLRRLQQNTASRSRLFWAVLSFCLLFQFELAMAPLFLLIPYLIWRNRQKLTRQMISFGGAALVLGLLPQLIFDLTHRFAQVGGFLVWVVYRVVALAAIKHAHGLSLGHLQQAGNAFGLYFGRIWSVNNSAVAVIMTLLAGAGFIWLAGELRQRRNRNSVLEIVWIATFLLGIGYGIHGSPSEAYFPPWFVLLPILVAFFLEKLLARKQFFSRVSIFLLMTAYGLVNLAGVARANFFVSTSNTFSYGPSLAEQQAVGKLLGHLCQTGCNLVTTREGGKFVNFFANYRLENPTLQLNDVDSQNLVYLEAVDSPLANRFNTLQYHFPTLTVFQPLSSLRQP